MVAEEVSEADLVEDLPGLTVADVRVALRSSAELGPSGQRTLAARAAGRSGHDDISERVEELPRTGASTPRRSEWIAVDPAQAWGAPDLTEEGLDGR